MVWSLELADLTFGSFKTCIPLECVRMAIKMRHSHLLTSTWRPPSLGLPSIQNTSPVEDATGAPSFMLWLVMSSLDIGLIQLPTGASCDAITVQTLLLTTRLLVAGACFDLHRKIHLYFSDVNARKDR